MELNTSSILKSLIGYRFRFQTLSLLVDNSGVTMLDFNFSLHALENSLVGYSLNVFDLFHWGEINNLKLFNFSSFSWALKLNRNPLFFNVWALKLNSKYPESKLKSHAIVWVSTFWKLVILFPISIQTIVNWFNWFKFQIQSPFTQSGQRRLSKCWPWS